MVTASVILWHRCLCFRRHWSCTSVGEQYEESSIVGWIDGRSKYEHGHYGGTLHRRRILWLFEVWRRSKSNHHIELGSRFYVRIEFFFSIQVKNNVSIAITNPINLFSLAESVRVMFAIAVFLSYGLQFYIPMKIIGPWFERFFKQNHQKLADGILRVSLVIVTCKTKRICLEFRFSLTLFF